MYPGAWITAQTKGGSGADLVCWNCAARSTHGATQEVWVWEFKAQAQSRSSAANSLTNGINWARGEPLKAKNAVVVAGPKFPQPRTSTVLGQPNELVTVYSESNPKENGVEWYKVDKFKKVFASDSPERKMATSAEEQAVNENLKTEEHRDNLTEPPLVEDKVSGWASAGGVGVLAAAGGWLVAGFAGPAVVAGGTAVGAETLRRSMFDLAG